MIKQYKNRSAYWGGLLLGAFVSFAGCESEGPAEKAGKSVDKGIQNAKDAINPPGPAEQAGRNLDKATKP